MSAGAHIRRLLSCARRLAARGNDAAAKRAYVDVLRLDSKHFDALNELGALAKASGHRSAARSVYVRAVQLHCTLPGAVLERPHEARWTQS
jgi:Tfp pilus assembly protein PilF